MLTEKGGVKEKTGGGKEEISTGGGGGKKKVRQTILREKSLHKDEKKQNLQKKEMFIGRVKEKTF